VTRKRESDLSELLSAYLDGELDESERARVVNYLHSEPGAARLLEELRQTQDLLRALPAERAPQGFADDVIAAAERRALVGGAGAAPEPRRTRRWTPLAAAASIALMICTAGYFLFDFDSRAYRFRGATVAERDEAPPAAGRPHRNLDDDGATAVPDDQLASADRKTDWRTAGERGAGDGLVGGRYDDAALGVPLGGVEVPAEAKVEAASKPTAALPEASRPEAGRSAGVSGKAAEQDASAPVDRLAAAGLDRARLNEDSQAQAPTLLLTLKFADAQQAGSFSASASALLGPEVNLGGSCVDGWDSRAVGHYKAKAPPGVLSTLLDQYQGTIGAQLPASDATLHFRDGQQASGLVDLEAIARQLDERIVQLDGSGLRADDVAHVFQKQAAAGTCTNDQLAVAKDVGDRVEAGAARAPPASEAVPDAGAAGSAGVRESEALGGKADVEQAAAGRREANRAAVGGAGRTASDQEVEGQPGAVGAQLFLPDGATYEFKLPAVTLLVVLQVVGPADAPPASPSAEPESPDHPIQRTKARVPQPGDGKL
jgi:hypothetical protein